MTHRLVSGATAFLLCLSSFAPSTFALPRIDTDQLRSISTKGTDAEDTLAGDPSWAHPATISPQQHRFLEERANEIMSSRFEARRAIALSFARSWDDPVTGGQVKTLVSFLSDAEVMQRIEEMQAKGFRLELMNPSISEAEAKRRIQELRANDFHYAFSPRDLLRDVLERRLRRASSLLQWLDHRHSHQEPLYKDVQYRPGFYRYVVDIDDDRPLPDLAASDVNLETLKEQGLLVGFAGQHFDGYTHYYSLNALESFLPEPVNLRKDDVVKMGIADGWGYERTEVAREVRDRIRALALIDIALRRSAVAKRYAPLSAEDEAFVTEQLSKAFERFQASASSPRRPTRSEAPDPVALPPTVVSDTGEGPALLSGDVAQGPETSIRGRLVVVRQMEDLARVKPGDVIAVPASLAWPAASEAVQQASAIIYSGPYAINDREAFWQREQGLGGKPTLFTNEPIRGQTIGGARDGSIVTVDLRRRVVFAADAGTRGPARGSVPGVFGGAFAANPGPMTKQQVAEALGLSPRTIEPDLFELTEVGVLVKEGTGDNATYRLAYALREAELFTRTLVSKALTKFYSRPKMTAAERAAVREQARAEVAQLLPTRVAINGAGRIGVNLIRAWLQNPRKVQVVAINDIAFNFERFGSKGLEDFVTLLEREFATAPRSEVRDVTFRHGQDPDGQRWLEVTRKPSQVGAANVSDVRRIYVYDGRDPAALPWRANDVDVVLESTGVFTNRDAAAKHLAAGAKIVIITAPATGELLTIAPGVNQELLSADQVILSCASCTTNAIAPPLKRLLDAFGIPRFYIATTHAYTADGSLKDTLRPGAFLRGREAAENIIPTSTGAARAIGEVIPELAGKGTGIALRVPVPDGSIVGIVADVEKPTTKSEVNELLQKAARGPLNGIMAYTEEELVSHDILGRSESSIIAGNLTEVSDDGRLVTVWAWYDNEFGYSNRVMDLVSLVRETALPPSVPTGRETPPPPVPAEVAETLAEQQPRVAVAIDVQRQWLVVHDFYRFLVDELGIAITQHPQVEGVPDGEVRVDVRSANDFVVNLGRNLEPAEIVRAIVRKLAEDERAEQILPRLQELAQATDILGSALSEVRQATRRPPARGSVPGVFAGVFAGNPGPLTNFQVAQRLRLARATVVPDLKMLTEVGLLTTGEGQAGTTYTVIPEAVADPTVVRKLQDALEQNFPYADVQRESDPERAKADIAKVLAEQRIRSRIATDENVRARLVEYARGVWGASEAANREALTRELTKLGVPAEEVETYRQRAMDATAEQAKAAVVKADLSGGPAAETLPTERPTDAASAAEDLARVEVEEISAHDLEALSRWEGEGGQLETPRGSVPGVFGFLAGQSEALTNEQIAAGRRLSPRTTEPDVFELDALDLVGKTVGADAATAYYLQPWVAAPSRRIRIQQALEEAYRLARGTAEQRAAFRETAREKIDAIRAQDQQELRAAFVQELQSTLSIQSSDSPLWNSVEAGLLAQKHGLKPDDVTALLLKTGAFATEVPSTVGVTPYRAPPASLFFDSRPEGFEDRVEDVIAAARRWAGADQKVAPTAPAKAAEPAARPPVTLFAQRITATQGARTGEVSLEAALAAGATGVIVGHSETRPGSPTPLRDSPGELHAQLARAAARPEITTMILAVGERSEATDARRLRRRDALLRRQLRQAIADIPIQQLWGRLVVAYEPRWAIAGSGSGRPADGAYAQSAHQAIRRALAGWYGQTFADQTRIIYGGSATADNAAEFLSQPDVDGLLPGGASTTTEKFIPLLQLAHHLGPDKLRATGRRLFIAGNHKTYPVSEAPDDFLAKLRFAGGDAVEVALAPTFSSLSSWREALGGGSAHTLLRWDIRRSIDDMSAFVPVREALAAVYLRWLPEEAATRRIADYLASSRLDGKEAVDYVARVVALRDRGRVHVLAQRITATEGARTGEVSLPAALAAGATGVIVGHSETRPGSPTPLRDSYKEIKAQVTAAVARPEIQTIILAIGEQREGVGEPGLAERDALLERQLSEVLKGLTAEQLEGRLVIAYEPRWAIAGSGQGRAATAAYAQDAHFVIRELLAERYSDEFAKRTRIIYGGSATAENAAEYLNQLDIDGLLPGGASTATAKFVPLLQAAQAVAAEKLQRTGRKLFIAGNHKTYAVSESPSEFAEALASIDPLLVELAVAPTLPDLAQWSTALATVTPTQRSWRAVIEAYDGDEEFARQAVASTLAQVRKANASATEDDVVIRFAHWLASPEITAIPENARATIDGWSISARTWLAERAVVTLAEQLELVEPSNDARLIKESIAAGELTDLGNGTYLAYSHPGDTARTEQRTFTTSHNPAHRGRFNGWRPQEEADRIFEQFLPGAFAGKTMYLMPYLMGPTESFFEPWGVGIQFSDSRYLAVQNIRMKRLGAAAFEALRRHGQFVAGEHITRDLNQVRRGNPQIGFSDEVDDRYFFTYLDERNIRHEGSAYGGNGLFGKIPHGLRLASFDAHQNGWLVAQMALLGVRNKKTGEADYIIVGSPSGSGKTNFAMMQAPAALTDEYEIEFLGDDIVWMRKGEDGRVYALNPEYGAFGIAKDTNWETNPNAMAAIGAGSGTIFTNVARNVKTNEVWWEGKTKEYPEDVENWLDWKGQPISARPIERQRSGATGDEWAQPNSRYTVPLVKLGPDGNPMLDADGKPIPNIPNLSPHWNDPNGVPITAVFFGGRVTSTREPLIRQLRTTAEGVYDGALMGVETTTAIEGASQFRSDAMAMMGFYSYPAGEYYQDWLDMMSGEGGPAFFHFNWFAKDEQNNWLWPGYSENLRVVLWAIERAKGGGEAVETPVGYLPTPDALDVEGLEEKWVQNIPRLTTINPQQWFNPDQPQHEVARRTEDIVKYYEVSDPMPDWFLREHARFVEDFAGPAAARRALAEIAAPQSDREMVRREAFVNDLAYFIREGQAADALRSSVLPRRIGSYVLDVDEAARIYRLAPEELRTFLLGLRDEVLDRPLVQEGDAALDPGRLYLDIPVGASDRLARILNGAGGHWIDSGGPLDWPPAPRAGDVEDMTTNALVSQQDPARRP